jgi:uncharacterized integral membrane protein
MGLCPGLNHSKWVTSQNRFGSTAIGSRKASRTMSDSPACGKPVDGGGSMRRDHIRGGAEPSKPQTSLICLAAMAIGFCYTTQDKLLVLVLLVLVLLLVLFMFNTVQHGCHVVGSSQQAPLLLCSKPTQHKCGCLAVMAIGFTRLTLISPVVRATVTTTGDRRPTDTS